MFNAIKNKIIKIEALLLVVLFTTSCVDQQSSIQYQPDDAYVSMMADIIFANKVHSKTKYSERDSTMLNLLNTIERINGKNKIDFDLHIKSLQHQSEHYQEFLDSVDSRLKLIYGQLEAQKDSFQNISQKEKEQLDKLK